MSKPNFVAAAASDSVDQTLPRGPGKIPTAANTAVAGAPATRRAASESIDDTLAPSDVRPAPSMPGTVRPAAAPTTGGNGDQTLHKSSTRTGGDENLDTINEETGAPDPDRADDATIVKGGSADRSVTDRPAQTSDGEYEILQVLGRGGMGVVYKARQIQLNRLVALKMILAGSHASAEEMHRFDSEAKAVAQLQHPNIVQIYAVGRREGRPFFALEFIDGGSLQDKLNGVPLPPREAASTAELLARAVHFAHEKGIVHRDLKPANVLLTRGGVPKITDFGLAKQIKGDDSQTHTGTILGTPSYMSPEQAQGLTKDIGPAADVYSLGAIFYEMLTGRPPFRGQTVMDTLNQVQNTEPVSPRRLQPGIPADLETICLKCLRKEPSRRYESAQELAEDLHRHLKNVPIKARPIGLVERVAKWARRRPAVAGLLAALAVVLTAAFFALMTLWLRAETAWRDADAAKLAAQQAEASAKEQRNAALAAEAKVTQSYRELRGKTYIGGMDLAQRALRDGYQKQARQILDKLSLRKGDEPDLRGFEWYYLRRLCDTQQQNVAGHIERITHIALSADSRLLITAGLNRTIKVWNTETETELFRGSLDAGTSPLRSLACEGDGSLIAAGGLDGAIHLWAIDRFGKKGKRLGTFPAHDRAVLGLVFSPDGKRLASAGDDGCVKVWDVASLLQSASDSGSASPAPALELRGHKYPAVCIAFNLKGNLLASGSEDKTIVLWDLDGGKEVRRYTSHSHWVSCVGFSPDDLWLVSGSWDRTVRLWAVASDKAPRIIQEHDYPLQSVAFSPDGNKVASLSRAGNLKVWDTVNLRQIQELPAKPGLLRTVAFSADGQKLVSIEFLKQAMDTSPIFAPHHSVVTGVKTLANGELAVSTSSWFDKEKKTIQGEIIVWSILDRQIKQHWKKQTALIRGLAVGKNGTLLATVSEDRTVLAVDLATGTEVALLNGHPERALTAAFAPASDLLASAGEDGEIRLWHVDDRRLVKTWTAHKGPVGQVAFSPDGKWLASCGEDRKVHLWEVLPGGDGVADVPARTFTDHTSPVSCLRFDNDGRLLVTGGEDQRIVIRDLKANEVLHELTGHNDVITALAFSPDGQRLASGSLDHTVKLWDPASGQEMFTLHGHTDGVTGLAFDNSGRILLSSSLDRTVRIWDGRE